MRATVMYKAGDVQIERVADPSIQNPTDAIIRVTRACICGSDLWPYNGGPNVAGQQMGHEAIGVVEEVGSDVKRLRRGQIVVMPFAYSDGRCMFCDDGLQTACVHGGFFGNGGEAGGAQAEALRVPQADGTLYPLNVGEDDALMPSLLTLSDVMGTGHHAAITARVRRGGTVAVVGDGAVGLCGVLAAKRLGAEQIIIMGRHQQRIELARQFGATEVVSERRRGYRARARADKRLRSSVRSRMCRHRAGHRHLDEYRPRGRCGGPRGRAALYDAPRRAAHVLPQRHSGRRAGPRARLHRRAPA
jgi:threonine dehydrogenase-like Zn-dependent dehydrogenase